MTVNLPKQEPFFSLQCPAIAPTPASAKGVRSPDVWGDDQKGPLIFPIFRYGRRSLVVEIASARATGPGSELFFFIFFSKIAKLGVKIRKIIKKSILVKFRSKNRKKRVFLYF